MELIILKIGKLRNNNNISSFRRALLEQFH